MTEWKEIEGFDYLISNEGDVRRKDKTRCLKLNTSTRGSRFCLLRDGSQFPTAPSTLMRKYWKFEWIKELDDDEEVKPFRNNRDVFITNKGRLFNLQFYRWVTLYDEEGTYYQQFSVNGVRYRLHTELGRHFHPDYEEGLHILHFDENLPLSEVNQLSNLWVGTHKENMDDKFSKGRGNSPVGERNARYNPSLHLT